MNIKTILLIIICLPGKLLSNNEPKPNIISLENALKQNILKCEISGSFAPGIYFRLKHDDGLHFGKCMEFVIKNLEDSFYYIQLDAGSTLIPIDSTFQTMYITKTVELPIYPNSTMAFNLNAMCGQIHDNAPYKGINYTLDGKANGDVEKAIQIIEQNYLQNHIGQYLLWAIANQASIEELIKYGADSSDLIKIKALLSNSNLKNKILSPVKKKNTLKKKKANSKPTYKNVTNIAYYGVLTYSVILTTFGLVYVFRNIKLKKGKTKDRKEFKTQQ